MGKIFTAGSSYEDIEKCISKLNEKRIKSYFSKNYKRLEMKIALFYCMEGIPGADITEKVNFISSFNLINLKEMDETAKIYMKTIEIAQKFSKNNMIAVKFSSMANFEEMKALNRAEKELIDIYYDIDKNKAGFIEVHEVFTLIISKIMNKF